MQSFTEKFGRVYLSSGSENYFGQGWDAQKYLDYFPGAGKNNAIKIYRTATIPGMTGNMPLKKNLQPRELFPSCIKVSFRHASTLNAVGLSGPPFLELLEKGEWQKKTEPFGLSIMSVGDREEIRLRETELLVKILLDCKRVFQADFFVEKNYTCPNTKHKTEALINETQKDSEKLAPLQAAGIMTGAKLNIFAETSLVKKIQKTGIFSFITNSNSIPWNDLPDSIKKKCFGSLVSPLAKYGGGGFSGPDILPAVLKWIEKQREAGINMPIIASNGIQTARDVLAVRDAGGSGVQLGIVKIVRPHRRQRIIDCANSIKWIM